MDMKFTRENVEYYWKLLNTSHSSEEKKLADEYLRKFKEDPSAREICVHLFESTEVNSHFLAALILQQIIKEKINDILESKQLFFQYRDLLLNNLLEKQRKAPSFILERVCFSISILISIGSISYWPDALEDIINFAKTNKENCYLALIILENINKELFELNVSAKNLMRIKCHFRDKLVLIQEFIFLVLTSVNSQEDKVVFDLALKLTNSWVRLGLNVLKIPAFSQSLISQINTETIKSISEIFSESIVCSSSAKYYSVNEIYDLEEISSSYNPLEIQSIETIVDLIKNFLMSSDVKENPEILDGLSNIFASLMENYVNLLFYKNSLSQNIREIFFVFISHKNRKVSYKFFESINELREFINRGFKFSNFSDEEKVEFGNFLIKICEAVMLSCKLKNLNMNMDHLRKTQLLSSEDFQNIQESNDDDSEENLGLSLSDYRRSSEDVFYNVFLILTYNFGENGGDFFFNWINNILNSISLSDENITSDMNRLLVLEIILIVVKSILDAIDVNEINTTCITNFCLAMLNSKTLHNDHLIVKFLLFLDQASPIVAKDVSLLPSIFSFLINLAANEILQTTACSVLLGITDFLKFPYIDGFNSVYEIYTKNYDNMNSLSVIYLSNCMANLVGILDKQEKKPLGLDEDQIINYLNFILVPANERIASIFSILSSQSSLMESDITRIKSEILKNYLVHNEVLKKAYFLTNKILKGIFINHMRDTCAYTETIFKLFHSDSNLIKDICKIYIKAFHHLGEDCQQYFDQFNEIMINAYISNIDNYTCINVLRILYSEVAKNSPTKKQSVSQNFFNLCDVINKNIFIMKKNRIDLIEVYAGLIVKVLETVDYLVVNQEVLNTTINIFLEALRGVSEPGMNKAVIRTFNRVLSELKIIPKEATYQKFPEIITGVFLSCDHYESNSILDFTHFVKACLDYDEGLTMTTIITVLSNPKFKFLKQMHIDLIVKYISYIGRQQENKLKALLNDLVNLSKGMGQTETFIQYELELAHYERKTNPGNSI